MMIESPTSVSEDIQEELRRAQQDRRAFSNSAERATHLRLFFAWLPKILQDAPGIPWDQLPSQAMGHLVRTVADHPDAIPIALAVGCAMHAMKRNTLLHVSSMLLTLCRRLRTPYEMTQISQLRDRAVWMRFVSGRQLSGGEARLLATYASVASGQWARNDVSCSREGISTLRRTDRTTARCVVGVGANISAVHTASGAREATGSCKESLV